MRNNRNRQPAPAVAEAGAARLRAKQPTRSRRKDFAAVDVGQLPPRDMKSTGPASEALEPQGKIEVERGPVDKQRLENLKFDQEKLTIMVHESTDPNDEPIPYVINGGIRQAFIRGEEIVVKRMFVEILARMKKTTFTQQRYKDTQNIDAIRNVPHSALRFPFTVIHDPNPRGREWLKAILAGPQ